MNSLGVVGAAIILVAESFYIWSILFGTTRPSRSSWGVWSLTGVLGFSSAVSGGAGAGALVAGAFMVVHLIVFALSCMPKYRKPGQEPYDFPLIIIAVAMLIGWQVFGLSAAWAATVAWVSEAIALTPTLRESWRNPKSESLAAWSADVVGASLAVLALEDGSYPALAYPLYLVAATALVSIVLILARAKKRAA